ncbi:methyltransferase [Nocardia nova SH22a]|uniref:S-adenosyl-L-methionine-dependent methyltransferase n=1 Tax=Nocardia nova SH22a TaxID=1415166 RepID=W5TGC8_9NOCA|nr:SAM-dependent methyltransferase [Nocardia nova]AHH18272.1 methyltransferase [Nocardia nova SH22a]
MTEQTSNVPVAGVAMTAVGVAVIRARETARADRLYADPLARMFADAARAGFGEQRWARLTALADQFYEGRTVGVRLVDDRFRAAADAGIRQFVLLGAGLDTRAFRMDLPPRVQIYEIDLPETFAFKEPILDAAGAVASCGRRVVIADLRSDWQKALLDSGFRPDLPTSWVDEGSLGRLTQEWNQRVVTTLTGLSAPGSLFGASRLIAEPDGAQYRELRRMVADAAPEADVPAEPVTADADFDVERWLGELGWDTEFRSWNDMVAGLARPAALQDSRIGTIAAVRRAE